MKLNALYVYLCAIVLLASLSLGFTGSGAGVSSQSDNWSAKPIKYRVGHRERTKDPPSVLEVQISVEPEHFNREDMMALARQLNKDFRHEPHLSVAICDEYKTARYPHIIGDILRGNPVPALRGFYVLDRVKGKEGISFSTARGKSLGEVDIDL